MAAGSDFNNHHWKQRQQYLNLRGAQIAEQRAGETVSAWTTMKARGSRKQLVGTVLGIAASLAVLVLLAVFHVI